jgi:hypothetical protein
MNQFPPNLVQQPLGPFTWGANGQQVSPEQLAAQQAQSADFSPVGHWSQGMARITDALSDNILGNRMEDQMRAQSGFPARPGGMLGLRMPIMASSGMGPAGLF